jgi:hypothetical protein
MSVNKLFMAILALSVALLVACGSGASDPGVEEPAATTAPQMETPETESAADTVSAAATAFLAQQLGIAEGDIAVVSAEETEFTDSCLGLGGPAESCLQAITPGWLLMMSAAGQTYEVHTDETGQQVRVAVEMPETDGAGDTAAAAAQEFLVAELGVALGDVQVISTEKTEFTDSCLGLGGPDESCLQAITPGWIVTTDVAGQTYEVHTDETGQQVRVVGQMP